MNHRTNAIALKSTALLAVSLGGLLFAVGAIADTASEVRDKILGEAQFNMKNLRDQGGGTSKNGSLEFWSSGGLLIEVPADQPIIEYDEFSITPKHIRVITLVEDEAAVAMYYAEGSVKEKGGERIPHYLTRVTEVLVKESGKWVTRAAHFSPVGGGSGTNQTAP